MVSYVRRSEGVNVLMNLDSLKCKVNRPKGWMQTNSHNQNNTGNRNDLSPVVADASMLVLMDGLGAVCLTKARPGQML